MFFQRSRHVQYPSNVILFHTSVPNGNFTHSVHFRLCRFIQHTRFKAVFHDSTAKEIRSCISTSGQYCVVNFPFIDRVNETNRTYPKLVAMIQVYMSNKTQHSNYFHYFENLDRIKICLTL